MKKVMALVMAVMMCLGIVFTAQSEPYAGNDQIISNQTWIDSNTEQRVEMVRDANVALRLALIELSTIVAEQTVYMGQLEDVIEYLMIIEHGDPEHVKPPIDKEKT